MFLKPKRKVKKVFIHCSDSDNPNHDDISVIHSWHLERKFKTVGYHYFITNSGQLQLGRSLEVKPAAQLWHNTGSIAICLSGKLKFNGAQKRKLARLCKEIEKAYNGNVSFHGHSEVNKHKTCPNFDYKGLLKLDSKGKLGI